MTKIQVVGFFNGEQGFSKLSEKISDMLGDTNYIERVGQQMGAMPLILIVYILVMICFLIVFVLFYARILQILVMMAVAPIPIVTLIHEEHRQIGVSFIKSFCAVVLQGAVMLLIIQIYSQVVNFAMIEADNIISMIWTATGYMILLVVALVGSGALSKKILAAI